MLLQRMDETVCVFIALALGCFVVGFAVQDFGGKPGVYTDQSQDSTWGTWSTAFLLAVESFVFCCLAPGFGQVFKSAAVAFFLEGASWLCYGSLSALSLDEDGTAHLLFWQVSLELAVLACIAKVCAVLMALGQLDRFSYLQGKKIITAFSGIAVALGLICAVIPLLNIELGSLHFLAALKIGAFVVLLLVACQGGTFIAAGGILAGFLLSFTIKLFRPSPFVWSGEFNDTGLFHAAQMLYLAATMAMLQGLNSKLEEEESERELFMQEQEEEEEERRRLEDQKRAEAELDRKGGFIFGCMGCVGSGTNDPESPHSKSPHSKTKTSGSPPTSPASPSSRHGERI